MTPRRAVLAPEPVDEVADAQAAHQGVLERIGAGEPVTPTELLEVEATTRIAETRVGLLERRRAEEADAARRARIAELQGSLTDGHLHGQAVALLAAHEAAVEALAVYRAAAEGFVGEVLGAAKELVGLRPLPAGLVADWSGRAATIHVDGEVLPVSNDWPAKLVTQAAADALPGPDRKKVLAAIAHPSPVEALRRHWAAS